MQLKETNEKKFHQSYLVDIQSLLASKNSNAPSCTVGIGTFFEINYLCEKKEMLEQFLSLSGKKMWAVTFIRPVHKIGT